MDLKLSMALSMPAWLHACNSPPGTHILAGRQSCRAGKQIHTAEPRLKTIQICHIASRRRRQTNTKCLPDTIDYIATASCRMLRLKPSLVELTSQPARPRYAHLRPPKDETL